MRYREGETEVVKAKERESMSEKRKESKKERWKVKESVNQSYC